MATRLAPAHADAYNNMGNALRDAGDMRGADRALRAAVRVDPENAAALCNLGSLCTEMGRCVEARKWDGALKHGNGTVR